MAVEYQILPGAATTIAARTYHVLMWGPIAERPTSGLVVGDLFFATDIFALSVANSTTTWRDVVAGLHRSSSITYISGTGTAGADGTAQVVKSLLLPANTLTEVGDRIRIRAYWRGDTGGPIAGTLSVGGVPVASISDAGAATLFVSDAWLHYLDATHANVIEQELGALGGLSAVNVAGFQWTADQLIAVSQDAVANNHIVVFAIIVDILPKSTV